MRALAQRDRFDLAVELDAGSLWERLVAHPRVRESEDPAPDPAPPKGEPFLARRVSDGEVHVRQWAGPGDTASPVVVMRLEPRAGQGCRVIGHFENLADRGPARSRAQLAWRYLAPTTLLVAALAIGAIVLGLSKALLLPLLAILVAVPAAGVMLPLLFFWNAQNRRTQVESLWGLVGEVFVPVALPADPEEDPFRA